jgi:hypothetical protein
MKFNAEQLYSRPQCLDPVTTNMKIIFIFFYAYWHLMGLEGWRISRIPHLLW